MATITSFNKRLEELKAERSSFMDYWRELSDNILYTRGRFLSSDRNKGYKRNTKQFNNKPKLASRTLASGMMAGITSPARPWFRLSTSDPTLRKSAAVLMWLHQVQTIMYEVFSQSNFYNSLHSLYSEMGVFATGSMNIYEDFEDIIHCKTFTVGSYFIGTNGKGEVDTFYREYQKTVGQLVKEFGFDNCSTSVQQLWKTGSTEQWVDVVQAIEPNDDRDMQSPLAKDKKFRSVYYERSRSKGSSEDKFLRESGFDDLPNVSPRWDVAGEDIYGTDCPGMTAIGDSKALQLGERRKYQALDKIVDPPLQVPDSLKSKVEAGGLRNGDIVYTTSGEKIASIYDLRPDLNAMMTINQETEQRIDSAFYVDLFLMLANSDRRQITAREVAEKHEEKLLMLGPVLERLHNELLDPVIDRTFNILQRGGVLPPAPPELAETELRVEYVSVLAQAQRLVSTGIVQQVAAFTGELSAIWPEARNKFNANQAIDEFAESLGVSPNVIRSDDEANALTQQQQEAAQRQQAMEQGVAMVDAAKTASDTNVGGEDNALGSIMRRAGLS